MIVLSDEELAAFTGAIRADAQARELDHMGIPYYSRRNGKIVVLRASLEGRHGTPQKAQQESPALRLP
jgi:hypothetical protein